MKRLLFAIIIMMGIHVNAQWMEQTTGITTGLYSISAVNDRVAWASGEMGVVLVTTNGGTSWTNKGGGAQLGANDLYSIYAIDSMKALVTGSSAAASFLWRTTDGGTSWQQVHTQPGGFGDAIWMFDSLKGIYYGDPVGRKWSLWRTNDGGMSWDSSNIRIPQVGTEAGWNNAMWGSGGTVAFGTSSSKVYYSNDTGKTWSSSSTLFAPNSYAIYFKDTTNIYVGGTRLLRAAGFAGGFDTLSTSTGIGSIVGIAGAGVHVWFVRGGNPSEADTNIYVSADSGRTWGTAYATPANLMTQAFTHITAARTGHTVWAVRTGGSIVKGMFAPTGIDDQEAMPTAYNLEQNYPNPFNPSTTIKYQVPNEGHVALKVYDIMGKEVMTLVNEIKPAGNYEFRLNASQLASGIYLYKLTAGNYTDIKKMTLIK